jgi:hypothetical protein
VSRLLPALLVDSKINFKSSVIGGKDARWRAATTKVIRACPAQFFLGTTMPLSEVPALGWYSYSAGRHHSNLASVLRHPASILDPIKLISDLAQVDLVEGVDGFRIKVPSPVIEL